VLCVGAIDEEGESFFNAGVGGGGECHDGQSGIANPGCDSFRISSTTDPTALSVSLSGWGGVEAQDRHGISEASGLGRNGND
jgi:hypothetical protein